ncbi:hypothetical protein AUJ14_01980 [Candidatus Micrarchaeota archaeon CG1_02_55_22]|nr:MAG: hypothetical protein AUJ14_01980 [Candidatus Micrarchaeota archaeon CG1_02_55_22]
MKRLEVVTRKVVSSALVGNYKSVFKGRGLEFDGFREYSDGDDATLIDWRASARTGGKVLIKEFIEERNLSVVFIVDSSASMVFGSGKKLKSEYSAELVASLAYAMLQSQDSVGLLLFSDKGTEYLRPESGTRQFYSILKKLVEPRNYGGGKDYDSALKMALASFESGTLVFIVSDYIGFRGRASTTLKVAANKFDLVGVCIRDPRDMSIPRGSGEVALGDPFSKDSLLVESDSVADDYGHEAKAQVLDAKSRFESAGGSFLFLETAKPFADSLAEFLIARQARVR